MSRDPRLAALRVQLDALRAGMHALREIRQHDTIRMETTVARVRK